MSDQTAAQWFYGRHGQQSGPVDEATLKSLASSGELLPNDLIWRKGMPQWSRASEVRADLFPPRAIGEPPPLPPVRAGGPPPVYYPPPQHQHDDMGQNAGMRMLLPVGRSGLAIAAGYLGLLSVIPIVAPVALFVGVLAIRDIKRHPGTHGMGRAIFGIVMGIGCFLAWLLMIIAASM